MAVEEIHRPVPVNPIGVGYADGVDTLLRGEAGKLQIVIPNGLLQLSQPGSVEILQMHMRSGGPQLDGGKAQPLGGIQEVFQGIAFIMVVRAAKLGEFHMATAPL